MRRVLWLVLLAHVVWCVGRIPGVVFGKRIEEVREFRQQGDIRYLLARNALEGAEQIEWLRANTPELCAILFRGTRRGSLEFAAALLWPRELCAIERIASDQNYVDGKPLARGKLPGKGEGVLVLVARDHGLDLELR